MTEQIDTLAAALLEERDTSNMVLASMHRTHMRLLDVLGKMEQRLQVLESKAEREATGFDADALSEDQVNNLVAKLAGPLWNYEIEDKVHDYVDGVVNDLDIELEDLELSVSVDSVSARITGKP